MLTEVSLREQETLFEEKQVTALLDTAEIVKEISLKKALAMLSPRERQKEMAILMTRRYFIDYLIYHLSLEVAKVIASHDQRVRAIYLFEESANPDAQTEEYPAERDLTIHLLASVTAASPALEAFVAGLDRTLTELLNDLPSELFAGRTSFLNVLPVTEADIQEGRGYAVLLSSIHARPVKIWQRDS